MTSLPPDGRVTLFFFTQSMSVGAANAFAGIWFASQGLSPQQIGIVNAAPVLLLLISGLFIGRLADRAADWRHAIVLGCLASGMFPIGLFFVRDFWGVMLFWTLAVMAQSAVVPIADAAALRMSRRRDSNFGSFRAWGTIGYLLVIFTSGYLLAWSGTGLFLPLFVALGLVRMAASLVLPRFRAGPEVTPSPTGAGTLREVMKPWFLLPVLGWALVYATHLVLNAFQGLLWKDQGLSTDVIGTLIALGALSETVMFFAFKHIGARFRARTLMLLACLVAVVRWTAMAFSPGVEILFGLQLLHALTYALGFLACVNFVADATSETMAAEAQSFLAILEQGLGIAAFVAFGWLAGLWGAQAYFASALIAAGGALLVLVSGRPQDKGFAPQKKDPEPGPNPVS